MDQVVLDRSKYNRLAGVEKIERGRPGQTRCWVLRERVRLLNRATSTLEPLAFASRPRTTGGTARILRTA